MARRPKRPVFLERDSYRQRRIRDVARLLPVLGLVLFMVPLLWPEAPAPGEPGTRNAAALIYLFLVWAGLILAAGLLARPLGQDDAGQSED
jgi:hypothetical protein